MATWDLYTKDRIKTDEIMVRGTQITKGFYRSLVHVCIFNSQGEMLIGHQILKDEFMSK